MSGEGITGLDTLRTKQAEQGELLARVDERTKAQGRELSDVKATVHAMDGKIDGMASQLANAAGGAVARRDSATGVKDILFLLIGVAGAITAIVVAVVK